MLVSCAGVSLHQFRAYTSSSVCSIHSQGRHGNQGCGAKKQRWRFQEDSAAKESCVTLHEPRARRREINDVLQQTSFNGAIFFPTTCILHLTPVCHSLYIFASHVPQPKSTNSIHQPAFGKKVK
jgi:hypothetical protein